jgi:hypothetical protein
LAGSVSDGVFPLSSLSTTISHYFGSQPILRWAILTHPLRPMCS